MLQRIYKFLHRNSQKGQGIVEYALILAFVAAIAAFVFTSSGEGSIKQSIVELFTGAKADIDTAKTNIQAQPTTGQGN